MPLKISKNCTYDTVRKNSVRLMPKRVYLRQILRPTMSVSQLITIS